MKMDYKKELEYIFNLKRLFWVILGNTIYCVGVVAFILPMELITGGTTGLGLIADHYFGIPVEAFAAVFNALMFLVAWFMLGASFAMTTLVSSFYYPIILGAFQKIEILKTLTEDPMLGTICAGLLIGGASLSVVGFGTTLAAFVSAFESSLVGENYDVEDVLLGVGVVSMVTGSLCFLAGIPTICVYKAKLNRLEKKYNTSLSIGASPAGFSMAINF